MMMTTMTTIRHHLRAAHRQARRARRARRARLSTLLVWFGILFKFALFSEDDDDDSRYDHDDDDDDSSSRCACACAAGVRVSDLRDQQLVFIIELG
jgi:hypothetical protein